MGKKFHMLQSLECNSMIMWVKILMISVRVLAAFEIKSTAIIAVEIGEMMS